MRRILAIAAVLITLTTYAQPPSYVPANGLVGWWPFTGNADDDSGNGNNGLVNGASLTQDRFGNINCAYGFDGIDDFIQTTQPGATGSGITASFWFKSSSTARTPIMSYGGSSFGTLYEIVNNYWAAQTPGPCYGPTFHNRGALLNRGSDAQIDPNSWHHVVVILPQGAGVESVEIYIDGLSLTNTCSFANYGAPAPNIASTNPIRFGRNWDVGDGDFYFSGLLDDIGIWNRVLTPSEIQDLYVDSQAPSPCVSPDPVSFTGLGSSYTLADAPVTLVGSPAGGVFLGPGVTGSTFDPAAAGVGVHSIQYVYVDGNDCVNAAGQCTDVTVNAGVGGSNMTTGGVRVFPNPNRGQFTVELELNGLVGMQVFDARGAMVHNEVFTASGSRTQRTLDLSAFAKGSYTMLVDHDGQRVSQTVVVE